MARGRTALVLGFAACAFTGGPIARAQTPEPARITVDATATGTPLEKVWAYHGFDEVNYSTSTQGQALLRTLGSLGSTAPHIRSHFLLNSGDGTPSFKWGSTNVYSEDVGGNPIYDWTLMDGIMDAVTTAGTLPLVEIGFMPHDLAAPPADPYRNTSAYALDGHCFNPPKDYAKWAELIRTWALHVRDRYPNVESSWQWELWNEPDIFYWQGTPDEYLTLYDYTESALHSVLPNATLGGPAVAGAGGSLLRQLLKHCATGTNSVTGAIGTRLDLVTFHAKGGVQIVDGHVQMNIGNQLRLHRTGFETVSSVAPFKETPIILTEADPDGCAACALADHPEYAYRNTPAYAAYVVTMMKRTLELEAEMGVKLRGLLTWAFLFENAPYFAGYRVLSTNGIHLPVLNGFKLLGKLDGLRLPVTSSASSSLDDVLANGVRGASDIDGMATRDGNKVSVLIWNYHDDLLAVPATPIQLTVAMPRDFGRRASLTHLRVDDSHGDAYSVWLSQGSPQPPSNQQLADLRQAMEPSPIQSTSTVDVIDGTVSLQFTLPRFGLSLITLSTPSDGLDAGSSESPVATSSAVFASGGGCTCRLVRKNSGQALGTFVLMALSVAIIRLRSHHGSRGPLSKFSNLSPRRGGRTSNMVKPRNLRN